MPTPNPKPPFLPHALVARHAAEVAARRTEMSLATWLAHECNALQLHIYDLRAVATSCQKFLCPYPDKFKDSESRRASLAFWAGDVLESTKGYAG